MPPTLRALAPFAARWSGLPGNLRGAVLVLLAGLGFTGMMLCIKVLGREMSSWQIIFLRNLFAMALIVPIVVRQGAGVLSTRRPRMHVLRSVLGMGGVTSLILAITHIELTLATALGFTRILFITLLAMALLGEALRWRRLAATAAGFAGVLICLDLTGARFDPWVFSALGFALFAAGVTISVKELARTEKAATILVWSYSLMGLMAAVPMLFVWTTPSLEQLALIALMGVFTAFAQTCMVHGLRAGEASAVAPFEYARLPYAALFGFLLFQESPALSTLIGSAVIIASTLYIARSEARARRLERDERKNDANPPG